jgi:two-component system, NarL family, response regulator
MTRTSNSIRVLIIEDNELARLGIESLLQSQADLEVVGQAATGGQGVAMYQELLPDVVLCDLKLPDLDGDRVVRSVRSTHPDARVIILTHFDGVEHAFRAIDAGAAGFLTKESPGSEVVLAIREVAKGGTHIPAAIEEKLQGRSVIASLNARELQVLNELAKGLKNSAIAETVGISVKGVEMYVSRLLEKLNAKTRTEAVANARARGLL